MSLYDDVPETEPPWVRDTAGEDPPAEQWPGRGEIDGADRHTYMTLRRAFKEQCAARREACYFCGGAIDYSLKHGSPWSFEVHHTIPVSADPTPRHYLNTALWKASHALHNRVGWAEQAGEPDHVGPEPDTGWPSESWMAL